ncbi:hypothetical protein HS1_001685 [Candidatus Desulfofervidus auxilii]|uniref:Periplasmic heavy metal sensor n=2 Tax=Desulfofervidus auxilii TaxID=1621989 RepID=A0A7U4QLD9_DESA2|nr:hypothetical protein HS1_001685 [Candidatus Desulfofervidus auxilii]
MLLICVLATMSISWGESFRTFKDVKKQVITLRNWELMQEFNLEGERATEVFNILKKYDDEREKILVKRRQILKNLKEKVENPAIPEEELTKLIKEVKEIDAQLAELKGKEIKALSKVFSIREIGKYVLFMERFPRMMREALRMHRMQKRGLEDK